MNFRVLPEAQGDAIEAANWYEDRQPSLGDEFLTEVAGALDRIRQGPQSLSPLEHYTGTHDVCRLLLKRFPFAMIVLRRPAETLVVAIAHTRRHPLYWLDRLN